MYVEYMKMRETYYDETVNSHLHVVIPSLEQDVFHPSTRDTPDVGVKMAVV